VNPKLKKAMKLHQEGALVKAGQMYERVLHAEPRNVTALHFYGVLQHDLGRSSRALQFITKALRIAPDYLAAVQNLGNIYLETDQAEQAEDCYRKILSLEPASVAALNNLSIALRFQRKWEESEESVRLATTLEPSNKEAWYHLGRTQQARGNYTEALQSLFRATEIDPAFSLAQTALCRTTYLLEFAQGRKESEMAATREAYERWLAADPDNPICKFMLAACHHDSALKRAPDDFVVRLFDEFAESFDRNLTNLGYRAPDLVADEVARVYGEPSASLRVLDAGCGTGLLAELLRPWASILNGVDLSAGMLNKARQRGVYDRLDEFELTQFLTRHGQAFDLVVCTDTLCYFGELEEALDALARALRPGGKAVLTLERLDDCTDDFFLSANGRYRHAQKYLEHCIVAASLRIESLSHEVLRKEGADEVQGLLVTLSAD
jgi:predicted TPR repeat methyltransferase